ncbi:unnamed protein product [Brachionus calyciflorus]|uniref:Uncharacterized protein n=1 Tax=Brachionus calyciflorus TaxID=104777 RepID=A0A813M3J6_9BILA|nr:unnamed protein product [Brachionus calyciflorus]
MFRYLFMLGFDCLFSIFLVLNLVIFIWRIIWDYQDLYYKNSIKDIAIQRQCISSIISVLGSFLLMFYVKKKQVQSLLDENLHKNKKWQHKAKIKFFIILFSFANINQWRGVWNLTLLITDNSVIGIFTIGILSICGLMFMNRFCALISVPYILNKDCAQLAYQINPSSNKSNNYLKLDDYNIRMTRWLFMLNFILEYFADIFTIQSWRGLWHLMDVYVYPQNESASDEVNFTNHKNSANVSLIIGLSLYILLHMLNKPINKYSSKKEFTNEIENLNQTENLINTDERENYEKHKLTIKNRILLYIIFFAGFISTVNTWRALWMYQTAYLYPQIFHFTNIIKNHGDYDELILTSEDINNSILNLFYLTVSLSLLWLLHLTSAILSRASCEDDYFTAKNNFILKHNNFKSFIQKRFKKKDCLRSFKLKEIINYKHLFNKYYAEDKDLKLEKLIHHLNNQNEVVIKLPENNV